MQCVSYKQICYQAVNTKVMGLLVLISVFISLYCVGIFFFSCAAADLGHSFALAQGREAVASYMLSAVVVLPHASHLQPPQLSPRECHQAGMSMRVRPRRTLTACLEP